MNQSKAIKTNRSTQIIRVLCLIVLASFTACKQVMKPENEPAKSINDGQAQWKRIENNLPPVHYLKGSDPMQSISQLMDKDSIAGVSIVFMDKGEMVWQDTYGYANLKDSTKVTPKTVFNGASLSKPVSAMAALRLVEQGKLGLEEDINKYLVGWKVPESEFTAKEKVTLKRLMGHTAGFDRLVQSSFFPEEELPTIEQMLSGENPSVDPAVSLVYVPGQKQLYSNPGYSVMEKLIEDVTSKKFNTALTELIFEPVGMNESSFEQPVPDHLAKQMAIGYTRDLEPYPYKLFPYKAAGGIWTTPTDLAKFVSTVLNDNLKGGKVILSKQMTDSVFSKTSTRFGFAKIYNDTGSDVLIEHWGSNSGFTCYLVASLQHDQCLVIMTNSDNGMSLMSYITRAVAVAYEWDFFQPVVHDPVTLETSILTKFSGKFKGGNEVLKFVATDDELHFVNQMGTSVKLVPVSQNSFIEPNDHILFEFLGKQDNEVGFVRMTKADGYNSDYLKQ